MTINGTKRQNLELVEPILEPPDIELKMNSEEQQKTQPENNILSITPPEPQQKTQPETQPETIPENNIPSETKQETPPDKWKRNITIIGAIVIICIIGFGIYKHHNKRQKRKQ